MSENKEKSVLEGQFEYARRLTAAAWIGVLALKPGSLQVELLLADETLPPFILENSLQQTTIFNWLTAVCKSGKIRSRQAPEGAPFSQKRLFAFPTAEDARLILVHANQLKTADRKIYQFLAQTSGLFTTLGWPSTPNVEIEIPDWDFDSTYDLDKTVDRIFEIFGLFVRFDAAFLGIKHGATVKIISNQPDSDHPDVVLLAQTPVLNKLILTGEQVQVDQISAQTCCPFAPEFNARTGSWVGLPFVVGRRIIGAVCIASKTEAAYSSLQIQQMEKIAARTAPFLENAVAFVEVSRHLERSALLNELASAASIGMDAGEVAYRILRRLRKIFKTDLVSLMLLSEDRQILREFGHEPKDCNDLQETPVATSLSGYVLETGQPLRVGDVRTAPRYLGLNHQVQSELAVPLKYRGKVIGVMDLESTEPDAFSERDEQLLVVIASHLAGLIENIRLHEETRTRVKNLELLHQISQQLLDSVDVSEIAQIASALMAEQFEYELVEVALVDASGRYLITEGVGGAGNVAIRPGFRSDAVAGITGAVFQTGQGQMVNDTSQNTGYTAFAGWKSNSEICVPLRVGEHIFGVLNVECTRKNAFIQNDMLLVETFGSVLSSVLLNAFRYQELQTNYRHLKAVRETAIAISTNLDLDEMLARVAAQARDLVNANGVELGLVDHPNRVVEIKISESPWQESRQGKRIPFSTEVAGLLAVDGKSMLIPNFSAWQSQQAAKEPIPYSTVAGVPLMFQDDVLGTLVVSNDEIGVAFTPEDLMLLELLAPQIAVSIRNALLYQQLEENIQAGKITNDRLIQSARLAAVGEMAAGIAHELNNPLTTVSGFVELILDELPAENPQRADLELVLREAIRAKDVVRRLLDFSRPGEGFRVPSDINDLVSEVIALIQHIARTSGIEMVLELWNEMPLLEVDRDQIKQVLLNLLHNAIQAMPDGGLLRLQTLPETQNGQHGVQINIWDTGEGILPEHLGRIFEPFFTTRIQGKGTGLGLAVSYGIIRDHDGWIKVESDPGKGSKFMIWLPVQSI